MIRPMPYPHRTCSVDEAFRLLNQVPALNLAAEDLARMHPLVRAALAAATGESVEVSVVRDRYGDVASVRTTRSRHHCAPRTLHSLLNAAERLIRLERQLEGEPPEPHATDVE